MIEEKRYPWYGRAEVVDTNDSFLMQGDLVPKCPLIIPCEEYSDSRVDFQIDIDEYDVVILTQSCDLAQRNVTNVLVAPYYPLSDVFARSKDTSTEKRRATFFDKVKQGVMPGYHILSKDESMNINDFLLVDFRNVYAIHIRALKHHLSKEKQWIRLNSPYKEHLSQAFARYLMRVGLPMDIRNPFKK
jgi:hypothetical protein